jgi:hypothetical protein
MTVRLARKLGSLRILEVPCSWRTDRGRTNLARLTRGRLKRSRRGPRSSRARARTRTHLTNAAPAGSLSVVSVNHENGFAGSAHVLAVAPESLCPRRPQRCRTAHARGRAPERACADDASVSRSPTFRPRVEAGHTFAVEASGLQLARQEGHPGHPPRPALVHFDVDRLRDRSLHDVPRSRNLTSVRVTLPRAIRVVHATIDDAWRGRGRRFESSAL